MGHQFAEIAFTDTVKKLQTEHGSRNSYGRMEQGERYNHLLSEHEADFIQQRDSFYLATVSETGWPYVQHRGGAKGFLRVLNANTLGFADFSGNRQYVSAGNVINNDRVALILMDYPNRRRMKILGRIQTVNDWQTLADLEVADYRARVERGFLIKIEAFDWNCPQHIVPRFTEDELQTLLRPLQEENDKLKQQSPTLAAYPQVSGNGPLPLIISGIRQLTPKVRAYELRHKHGLVLPEIEAGAHLQVPVRLQQGHWVTKHYSIASNPARRDCYEIAVLRHDDPVEGSQAGALHSGGSRNIHQYFQIGMELNVAYPQNHFLMSRQQEAALLIAGGIGITPLKAMAQTLDRVNVPFELHYAGKRPEHMPYLDRLRKALGERLTTYSSEAGQRLKLETLLPNLKTNTHVYVCGPQSLIDYVTLTAAAVGFPQARIHIERFASSTKPNGQAHTVNLAKQNTTIEVGENETFLDALINAEIDVPYSCKTGQCKTCSVPVVEGEPEHFDACLTEAERNTHMCLCVSRAKTQAITLDL